MNKRTVKLILIRLSISLLLLLAYYYMQMHYSSSVNAYTISSIGSTVLLAWLIFMTIKVFKDLKNKWLVTADVLAITVVIFGFLFIHLVLALACC